MDGLRKRILLDLFVTPATVIPAGIGGSLLLLSMLPGPGKSATIAFAGLVGLLVALGVVITNFVFNFKNITIKATKEWYDGEQKRRDKELDVLDRKLQRTTEPSDENALRNLRTLYKSFTRDVANGAIPAHVPNGMLQQIGDIFEQCIQQLVRSYELWEQSRELNGLLQKEAVLQRREMIKEVEASVKSLADVLNQLRAMRIKTKAGELKSLQQKLNRQLEVAKITEERVSELDEIEKRFPEYQ